MINKHLFAILIAILPLVITSYMFFLKDRPVWPDESTLLVISRTLAAKGYMATNIYNGMWADAHIRAYFFPPVYFHVLAHWTNLFGSTIESIRLLSILLAVICLIVFYFFCILLFQNKYIAFLATVLISSELNFGRAARVARMDILIFFFNLSAYYIMLLAERKNSKILYLSSGILCSLATLTHPFGFLAPAIICSYLLLTKKSFKEKLYLIALIIIPVLLGNLLWLFSIRDTIDIFLNQYSLQFLRKRLLEPYPITLFKQFDSFRKQFLIYGAIILAFVIKILFFRKKYDIFILLGTIFSISAVMWGKELWYTLYFQPFIILSACAIVSLAWHQRNKIIIAGVSFIVIALFWINFIQLQLVYKEVGGNRYDYHLYTKRIADLIPQQASIFLSAIPDPYLDLRKNSMLSIYDMPNDEIPPDNYINLLNSVDYIILNIYSNSLLGGYLARNSDQYFYVGEPNQYSATVVKLIPRNERK